MTHFFISYKSDDFGFAEHLKDYIKRAGFAVWMDSDRLKAGQHWSPRIDEAISDALALIVVMTPEAKVSEYVTYEWTLALEKGIKVIPVMLRSTELHPRLKEIHYLDFTSGWRMEILMDALRESTQSYTSQLKASIKSVVEAGNKVGINRYFATNACFRHTIIHSLSEMKSQLTSVAEHPKYFVPASQYAQYLISLQRELHPLVKAIALVDQQEHFWQQEPGREIMRTARRESSRVFVFTTPEQFDENFETLLNYAAHYNVYAMSYETLARRFWPYTKDFSIIEADGGKILARYDDTMAVHFLRLCRSSHQTGG